MKYSTDALHLPSDLITSSPEDCKRFDKTQLSATRFLEKQMLLCFGAIPSPSGDSIAQLVQRGKSDSNDDDKSKNDTLAGKLTKRSESILQLENGLQTSPFEWSLDSSTTDLAEICPYSLYYGRECLGGSACKLRSVCTVRESRSLVG